MKVRLRWKKANFSFQNYLGLQFGYLLGKTVKKKGLSDLGCHHVLFVVRKID